MAIITFPITGDYIHLSNEVLKQLSSNQNFTLTSLNKVLGELEHRISLTTLKLSQYQRAKDNKDGYFNMSFYDNLINEEKQVLQTLNSTKEELLKVIEKAESTLGEDE